MAGILKKGLILILLLIVIAAGFLYFRGSSLIKSAVETYGPEVTGTAVSLGSVGFSPFSGAAVLSDFVIGNPEGFESENAFRFDTVSVKIEPSTLLSDHVHINEIRIEAPVIVFEAGKGGSNIQQLQKNLQEAAARFAPEEEAAATQVTIDDFYLTGAKATLAAGQLGLGEKTVTLPDIHLRGIGSDGESVTMAEASEQIMSAVMPYIMQAVSGELLGGVKDAATEKGQELLDKAKDKVDKELGDGAGEKLKEGLDGLLGKKKKKEEDNN